MMNKSTSQLLALMIFLTHQIYSQSYYYLVDQGVTAEYDMSAPNGITIMTSPLNDAFSSVQTLPFSWRFYGQNVTKYKVSDNGYITFDLTATVSDPNNSVLPNSTSPKNAIFVFWDNLELSNNPSFMTNTVKTYTIGASPNRIHVIQWDVTPFGKTANGNYLYFALRIYEKGYFDILLQQLRVESGAMSGTVGCQNASGTEGTAVAGSPNFTYKGGAYIKENCPVCIFISGAQPQYDVLMKKLDIPLLASANVNYDVKGTIINHGTQTINSMDISYQAEGNTPKITQLTGLNIKPNESYNFTHPLQWKPAKVGMYENLHVWIEKINNNQDMNQSDDTLVHNAFVNNGTTAPKKVLIEEFSTAPCGYCPDGHIVLDNILNKYPNVIGLTHHSGYQSDAMTINESVAIADAFAMGAPTASVDRILWTGQNRVAINRTDWEQRAIDAAKKNAPVGIKISQQWNAQTNTIAIQVDLDFVDYPYPGDMRINVFIVEDNVTGTGKGYDQTNYYNDDPSRPTLYQKGDPIVGYVHRHVIRAVLTGTWGEANIIPMNAAPGQKITRNYSYTVPANNKVKDLSIIAFVSYDDGEKTEIINSEISKEINIDVFHSLVPLYYNMFAFPNPLSSTTLIRYSIPKREHITLKIFDYLGRTVATLVDEEKEFGEHSVQFDIRTSPALNAGVYLYRLYADKIVLTKKMIVAR